LEESKIYELRQGRLDPLYRGVDPEYFTNEKMPLHNIGYFSSIVSTSKSSNIANRFAKVR
jgi:hypothetical protein